MNKAFDSKILGNLGLAILGLGLFMPFVQNPDLVNNRIDYTIINYFSFDSTGSYIMIIVMLIGVVLLNTAKRKTFIALSIILMVLVLLSIAFPLEAQKKWGAGLMFLGALMSFMASIRCYQEGKKASHEENPDAKLSDSPPLLATCSYVRTC